MLRVSADGGVRRFHLEPFTVDEVGRAERRALAELPPALLTKGGDLRILGATVSQDSGYVLGGDDQRLWALGLPVLLDFGTQAPWTACTTSKSQAPFQPVWNASRCSPADMGGSVWKIVSKNSSGLRV